MNNERIYTLLEKYWNCETSVSEEQELQAFFNFGNVPADLLQFVPVFAYKQKQQTISLSDDFDRKLEASIRRPTGKNSTSPSKYSSLSYA